MLAFREQPDERLAERRLSEQGGHPGDLQPQVLPRRAGVGERQPGVGLDEHRVCAPSPPAMTAHRARSRWPGCWPRAGRGADHLHALAVELTPAEITELDALRPADDRAANAGETNHRREIVVQPESDLLDDLMQKIHGPGG